MRYIRFRTKDYPEGAFGIVDGDTVRVLSGNPLREADVTGARVPLDGISEYLPPVDPPNIVAIGANYRAHSAECQVAIPDHPIIFIKTTNTVTGHGHAVVLPTEAPNEVDYEVELAVVMRDRTRNVPEREALSHVFGYTIGQDISARDCQMRLDKQWARGKCFDTFCPIGPWIETDIDPGRVRLRTILNGAIMQDDDTSSMIFSVACLVSYISRMMTLLPGTLIMTGTPSGVGFARKPPVFLRPGDVLISEITGIGRMENKVASEDTALDPDE